MVYTYIKYLLTTISLFSFYTILAQPSATPAATHQWVLVSTGSYTTAEVSTSPGGPADTSYGQPDTDPSSCTSACGGNCDGMPYIDNRMFGAEVHGISSCEQRAINLAHWNNPNPDSGVANGASSGTVYLPTAAQLNIIESPNPGAPGTGVGGDENNLWIIGGGSGPQTTINVSVNYEIDWSSSALGVSGGSGTQNYNWTSTHNDAGPGSYQTSGWNNGTADGFGMSFGEVLNVPIPNVGQNGGSFEVLFEANSNITATQVSGIADARAEHGPGMEGRASYEVQYDIWELQEIVVPVELLYFSATAQNHETVILEWATALEINSDKFIVQRLFDDEWVDLIAIEAARSSTSKTFYKTIDTPSKRSPFYRLKMIDLDGSFEYSSIASVTLSDTPKEPSVFPNPFDNFIHFDNIDNTSPLEAEVYDLKGKLILQTTLKEEKISTGNLESGLYILILKNEQERTVYHHKIYKQ